jgi:hypothetical protein
MRTQGRHGSRQSIQGSEITTHDWLEAVGWVPLAGLRQSASRICSGSLASTLVFYLTAGASARCITGGEILRHVDAALSRGVDSFNLPVRRFEAFYYRYLILPDQRSWYGGSFRRHRLVRLWRLAPRDPPRQPPAGSGSACLPFNPHHASLLPSLAPDDTTRFQEPWRRLVVWSES